MGTVITAEVVSTGEKRDQRGRKLTPPGRIAELLRAYRASGLTQAAFARREGLKYPTFAHWVQASRRTAPAQSEAVRFAEVKVTPAAKPSGESAPRLEARLPDGTAIIAASAAELAALLRALR
jgi:transcriptional regulator with XRE-family HTH domain